MKRIGITSGELGQAALFGGGKRPFRKRSCRSKSRCGGAAKFGKVAFGGSRGVRRSRRGSRRGGQGAIPKSPFGVGVDVGLGGSRGVRGVRRSRRGGRGGAYGADFLNDSGLPRGWF